jgi:hypothetical protein
MATKNDGAKNHEAKNKGYGFIDFILAKCIHISDPLLGFTRV